MTGRLDRARSHWNGLSRRARIAWGFAGASVAAWVIWTAVASVDPFRDTDAYSYWAEATALVEEGQFRERFDTGTVPTTWRPPLYGFQVSTLVRLGFGASGAVRAQQALVLLTALLLFACGRRLSLSPGWSAGAGLVYLWFPTVNRLSESLMSETTYLFLLTASLCLGLGRPSDSARRTTARLLACGAVGGLAMLCRTVFVSAIPGVAILALTGRGTLSKKAALAALAIGFVIVIAPWTTRNIALHGEVVIVNTAGSYNFWVGNVYDANGLRDKDGREFVQKLRAQNGEAAVAQELSSRAWKHIRDTPGESLRRWTRNAILVWTTTRGASQSKLRDEALIVFRLSLLFGAALCLLLAPRRREHWALASFVVLGTGLHAVTFVHWRFWLALLPAVLLLACAGAAQLFELRRNAARDAADP